MTNDEMIEAAAVHLKAEMSGDFDAMIETMTTDCYRENAGFGIRIVGRPAQRLFYEHWFGAFDHGNRQPGDGVIAQGFGDDFIVFREILSATMVGDFLGFPATGRQVRLPAALFLLIRDGLVLAECMYYDAFEFCQQLGVDYQGMKSAWREMEKVANALS